MAPSIQRLPSSTTDDNGAGRKRKVEFDESQRNLKKQTTIERITRAEHGAAEHATRDSGPEDSSSLPSHPLGVKPLGNAYDADFNLKSRCGRFSQLPDELLVQILDLLEASDLVRLGGSCKALYAFCHLDELWKTLFIEYVKSQTTVFDRPEAHTPSRSPPSTSISWCGTWRSTYMGASPAQSKPLDCSGLFSDVLHRPYQCANLPLTPFALNIPARNAITRVSDLTANEFATAWADKPFILTSPVTSWPIYKSWDIESLLVQYSNTVFRAESVDWPLPVYVNYMRSNSDESPLYLFDCHFASKMGLSTLPNNPAADYTPPSCFSPDLFSVLGSHRPHHAWLIVGPAGSGSTFHADPNGTSAWNAVIRGSKYWIMFPPPTDGSPPAIPGVHVSEDLSEVTSPLSLSEYLLCFHAEARRTPGCVEAVCRESEVLHVPAGWYHMVVNLEEGVAVTQNFVSEAGVVGVLAFMRDRADQVSGFKRGTGNAVEGQEFELFKDRLKDKYPAVYERAIEGLNNKDEKKNKKSMWDEVTGKTARSDENDHGEGNVESGGFSFGFDTGDDIDDAQDL